MLLTTTINNRKKELLIKDDEYLVDTLRNAGYLSVKRGCDTGACGLCTVLLNGSPILSCSTLSARVQGKEISTIENFPKESKIFASFMTQEGAEQCGFCSPGFTLTVIAMMNELQDPTDEEIMHYLNGNLCRCSGYVSQLRAIKNFMEAIKNENC
ncbi:2Fe-2S iron-sulfur cluster binding domain-containing protein [Cetobacterium sp. 8H]|uniref:(2Fe-2S)-binding protein n=1 Tax=Cetobacterium sp. 8H TaxID=2759681 RepID=UPI00163D0374|nr:2Fe-2S iron-sulfur cluster-binding protein [Cetobacterium sp. 8H]MBC2850478.1 2Fe-2S iron-sulfur cluster binding domain-containing protein [Cetobacterium sp. 8H]